MKQTILACIAWLVALAVALWLLHHYFKPIVPVGVHVPATVAPQVKKE